MGLPSIPISCDKLKVDSSRPLYPIAAHLPLGQTACLGTPENLALTLVMTFPNALPLNGLEQASQWWAQGLPGSLARIAICPGKSSFLSFGCNSRAVSGMPKVLYPPMAPFGHRAGF